MALSGRAAGGLRDGFAGCGYVAAYAPNRVAADKCRQEGDENERQDRLLDHSL